jgi:hypothetical protein
MQVRAKVSPQEIREAARMSRPTSFWFKFFLANWYSLGLALVVIAANVTALANHRHVQVRPVATLLAICAFFIGYRWYRWNDRISRAALAASGRSGTLALETSGIQKTLATGASTFVPWASYTGWREGKSVFVLSGKDGSTVIPIDDGTRESIRGLLASNINLTARKEYLSPR